ncbi:DEAD/DEAH box helicase [Gimesia algae]|uniref:Type III restriction enzyme, res subunit n=1 Tax=Gimesia algae TaxID=2527971 RepID=A0A517V715_9PLAN|nr:DEAD/DEAH box helicase family protein [Gimesia algae]QDT88798.1 Type III restriction enzyme, res subunit [Gimesia algae]
MSTYFKSNHRKIDLLPDGKPGFRLPQIGAASSLLSHATRRDEPAVVALPTGTGKTAVLQLTPFLWASGRVLVLTPSRLVRDQIAEGFVKLRLLKELGVVPESLETPSVKVVQKRIALPEEWEELREFDVVVTTPMSASPSIEGIAIPPSDLFALIMVDEAHHSPAISYAALLDSFPNARKAFFTATPFRRDKRTITGRLIYNYPLRAAIEDGTYGKVEYLPCVPNDGVSHDIAIAKMAEYEYLKDVEQGLDHRMMIRTDSVTRAEELVKIYKTETKLRLRLVTGRHSIRHVSSVINKLNQGKLDGIICVDMFGEGVDFPRLKLAALHAPHKSLSVTLQFIGRFARTNACDIGSAKFIAVPQEIDAEVRELFKSGANWQELVANLADARVEEEEMVRDGLSSFNTEHSTEVGEIDVTIDSLAPNFHVKVFRSDREPDWELKPFVPQGCELIFHAVSNDLASSVMVCQRRTKPKWLQNSSLLDTKNLLIISHYNRSHQLLFINSQEHGENLYESILEGLYSDELEVVCTPLSHGDVSRALRILKKPSFYNVGMRNRELGGQYESYRTLTGPKADRHVSRSDGNTRSRGHVFGGSSGEEESVTLGVSTLSKLWSNKNGLVPRLVDWCNRLAIEISNSNPVVTNSNIDNLDTGKQVSEIPSPPISMVWHEHVFQYPQRILVDGNSDEYDLTELELVIDRSSYDLQKVEFDILLNDSLIGRFIFSPGTPNIIDRIDSGPEVVIRGSIADGTLQDFLKIRPPTFFLADFSTITGNDWYRCLSIKPLNHEWIRTFDEFGVTVDIEREFENAKPGMKTIHAFTESELLSQGPDVVIYDHRTGEVADYISLFETDDTVVCTLAHCKGASGKKTSKPKKAATRVDDVYEVAGQVVKCLPFNRHPEDLKRELIRRIGTGSKLIRGTVEQFELIMNNAANKQFEYRICLVQPGLSASKLSQPVESVLAAAGEYISANTGFPPSIWISP